MSEIKKVKMQDGREWMPGDLAYLTEISYRAEDTGAEGVLTISGLSQCRANESNWPNPHGQFDSVLLRFVGVGNLKLQNFGPGRKQIMGFSIHDVTANGLEGIRYEVEDYEDQAITFHCRSFEASVEL